MRVRCSAIGGHFDFQDVGTSEGRETTEMFPPIEIRKLFCYHYCYVDLLTSSISVGTSSLMLFPVIYLRILVIENFK